MRWTWSIVVGALLMGSLARAQSPEAERRIARQLGEEGIAQYDDGNYAEAAERLDRAYDVVRVPTLGLWLARALEKSGRLVEASERYREVMRMSVAPDAPEQFAEAIASARAEYEALQGRIPTLHLVLEGAPLDQVEVSIDGKPIHPTLLGLPLPIDPGSHLVEAHGPDRQASSGVDLEEGSRQELTLVLTEVGPAPAASASPALGRGPDTDVTVEPHSGRLTRRQLAWLGLGVGASGLAVGTAAAVSASGKRADLDSEGCVDGGCPARLDDERRSYNGVLTTSYVGFGLGVVGAAVGTYLLVATPSDRHGRQSQLLLGPGQITVRGRF